MEAKFIDWSQHLVFLAMVIFILVPNCVHAQSGITNAPPFALSLRDNLKASFSIMVVAFLTAFIFMGVFSIYFRHCGNSSYVSTRNPIAAAADILRGRLHREVLSKCPILNYSAVKDLNIGKSDLECAVCLGEFQDKDQIRLLPKCHHVFHPDCIDTWFNSNLTCPVCRATLTEIVDNAAAVDGSGESEQLQSTTAAENELESQEPPATARMFRTNSSSAIVTHSTHTSPPIQSRMAERFPRSNSTGHSLFIEADTNTMAASPEPSREQIRRSASNNVVVLPGLWSSKRAWAFSSMIPPPLFASRNRDSDQATTTITMEDAV